MHSLRTLHRLNSTATAEAQRILNARHPAAPKPVLKDQVELEPVGERVAKMNKQLDNAKG